MAVSHAADRGSSPRGSIVRNLRSPIQEVRHADLSRASENSIYRSNCPVCHEGVLPVARNQATFTLVRYDRCTSCGQAFWYTDDAIGSESLPKEGRHFDG